MDATHRTLRHVIAGMLVYVDNAATRAELLVETGDPTLTLVYRRSAQRARRIIRTALKVAFTSPPFPDAFLTCDGKGGQYELVGVSKGAGPARGQEVVVYRDVVTGQLYFRTPQDFNERMTLVGGGGEGAETIEVKEQRA